MAYLFHQFINDPYNIYIVAARKDTELSVSRDDSGDLEVVLLHAAGSHIELDLMPASYIAVTSNKPIQVVQVRIYISNFTPYSCVNLQP